MIRIVGVRRYPYDNSIDGMTVCDSAHPIIMGIYGGIPKVKGLVELSKNILEDPTPPKCVACHVLLTPTVPVGIKQVGRERVTIGAIGCENMVVTCNIESLTRDEGVVLYG